MNRRIRNSVCAVLVLRWEIVGMVYVKDVSMYGELYSVGFMVYGVYGILLVAWYIVCMVWGIVHDI